MKIMEQKTAMFGAGCFWGIQYEFDQLKGVIKTKVGYAGGHTESPTYKEVCTDTTGHAEVVEVIYDPEMISYEKLLDAFWQMHDPTTMNRQGPDIGSQYRSIIFYFDEHQKELAEKSKETLGKSGKFKDPIVTEIIPASPFYEAEEYHQKYFEKTGQKVCH
jgi:peptide-methionine (S)-S-oxide reductase